jgi:hypothetical protein
MILGIISAQPNGISINFIKDVNAPIPAPAPPPTSSAITPPDSTISKNVMYAGWFILFLGIAFGIYKFINSE